MRPEETRAWQYGLLPLPFLSKIAPFAVDRQNPTTREIETTFHIRVAIGKSMWRNTVSTCYFDG